jgi:tRNA (guanosine-2'-O-)-methyltransferase
MRRDEPCSDRPCPIEIRDEALEPHGSLVAELIRKEPGTITRLLAPYLTEARKARIDEVLARRTAHVSVVLDDLYHEHNMSAVVRSMDAFGFQQLHVIEIEHRFKANKGIALGSEQWVSIYRHSSFQECMEQLRAEGRLILAADPPDAAGRYAPGTRSYELSEIPLSEDRPVALVFGRERDGLHHELRPLCDAMFYIPLKGFVESLNVSVTAAISLHAMRRRLEEMPRAAWQLPMNMRRYLRDLWYLRSLRRGEGILKEIIARKLPKKGHSTA